MNSRISSLRAIRTRMRLCGDLGLDESKSLGAVLVDVLLVRVGVVAIAAVGIGRVAVRLDDACAGWRARETSWARSELLWVSILRDFFVNKIGCSYALGCAGADVVWQTSAVVWVAHEDGSFDCCQCITGEGRACTTAERVVHDLTSLKIISVLWEAFTIRRPYLRISNEHNLGARAFLVVGSHGLDNSSGTLGSGAVIASATA